MKERTKMGDLLWRMREGGYEVEDENSDRQISEDDQEEFLS
jgi:hypothetical protein